MEVGEDSLYVRDGVGWRWGRTHSMLEMGWNGGGGGLTLCKRWSGMEVGQDSLYVRDGVGWRWGRTHSM